MVSRLFVRAALSLTLLVGCSSGGGASGGGGHTGGASGASGGGSGGSSTGGSAGSGTGGGGGASGPAGAGADAGDAGMGAPGSDAAAGSPGGNEAGTGDTPAAPGGFSLTSSVLPPNGVYPLDNTCAGADLSPPLAWSGAPAATMSYAIALRDNSHNTTRWVIWDIPPITTSLPPALADTADLTVPPGAKQVDWPERGNGYRYAGPCPGGAVHIYEFTLYALNVSTLPGVTTASDRDVVRTAVIAHSIATATLAGTSDATKK